MKPSESLLKFSKISFLVAVFCVLIPAFAWHWQIGMLGIAFVALVASSVAGQCAKDAEKKEQAAPPKDPEYP